MYFTRKFKCFHSSVTEQGLPYLTRQERHKYANLSDEEKTRLKVAQKKAATLESTTNSVRITLGLISMLLIGYISDRFGRRVALGVLLLGEILHISTMSIIVIMNLNVWLLILAGFFEAFFGGGLLAIYAQVAAVVVDVTRLSHAKAAERGKEVTLEKINQETWIWFTVFECLAFLCASSGSPIGGTIIYRYGFKAVVITCASLFIPSLIIIFILPETNKAHALSFAVEDSKQSEDTNNTDDDDDDETRTIEMKPEWKEVLVAKLKVVKHLDPLLIIIIIIVILLAVAAMVDLQYLVIYLMGAPFLWNPQQVGLYIGVSDLLSSVLGVTYTIIVVKIQQRRRAKEESAKNNDHTSQKEITSDKSRLPFLRHMRLLIFTLAGTLLLLTINKIMMGIAHQFATETANTIAYIATIPRLSKSLLTPIARSMFVLCTPQSNQGMIQSFGGFVARIGFLISLVALPAIYAATVTTFPPTVFIVVSGILILTILIDFAVTKHGLPYFTRKEGQRYENLSDDDKHKLKLAQKESATLEAVSNSVRITLGLITTLLMGYLSDRYGRRVVFGILLLGETFHIGITSLIVLLKLNLWMILLPGFLEAVFGGGLLSIFAQVAAIVVDICQAPTIESGNEKCIKTKQSSDRYLWTLFTLFDGIAGLCISAGSPIGGALIYNYGFPVATCTSLALLVPSLILVFFLPETNRNRGKRTDVQEKEPRTHTGHPDENSRSIPTEFVKTLKNRMTKGFKRLKSLDPVLIIIMSLVLFGSIGALSDLQYVAVYLMGPPFLWNPEAVGLYSGITDVTAALISVTCTIVIIKFHAKKRSKVQNNVKNQKNEKHYTRQMNLLVTVFAVAMVMLIINCSMVGMAHQFSLPTANILIYIAAVPRLMKSFCVPLIRTMFSICTHPSKQGFMQSVAAFVSRIGLLISFTALPAIYAATVLTFPGTVFIVVVIILMITLIIDLFVPLVVKKGNVDVKADEFNGIYSVQEEEKLDNILNFCGDTF